MPGTATPGGPSVQLARIARSAEMAKEVDLSHVVTMYRNPADAVENISQETTQPDLRNEAQEDNEDL